MADWIDEGTPAPAFSLPADNGTTISLADCRGQAVVLYFYPRDNTPGCTRQACSFRDRHDEMRSLGAIVLGVSRDSIASHEKFRAKQDLNFPLLADTDHAVAEQYGAWREKKLYGNVSWGIVRSTFLIDEAGIVRKVWRTVRVDGHDEQVMQALRSLKT